MTHAEKMTELAAIDALARGAQRRLDAHRALVAQSAALLDKVQALNDEIARRLAVVDSDGDQ